MSNPPSSYTELLQSAFMGAEIGDGSVLDLFAGCGGLSLGFESVGFAVTGYEASRDAWGTYTRNLRGGCHCEKLTPQTPFPNADILIGGPPCQPFSVGGHQHGSADSRNGFEIFVRAVEVVKPKLWLFENVKGMIGRGLPYLNQIISRMEHLGYTICGPRVLNALDFGVPQRRERVVVVGHLGKTFQWPSPVDQRFSVRSAIGRTASRHFKSSRFLTASMDSYIAKYEQASACKRPRDIVLDSPARTLTCRNLGGATGDMMRLTTSDGRRRLLSVAEAARLQSFPSWFRFAGSYGSQMRQIGNAVPPLMALRLAEAVSRCVRS